MPQFISGIVVIAAVGLITLSSCDDDIHVHPVEDTCPSMGNSSVAFPADSCLYNKKIHCLSDDQCKIGSKCCEIQGHCKRCIDLKDGTISKPKVQMEFAKKQRRKRQSYGCVSCACVRSCRSNQDCARYRRKRRCYHNSCSSYCVA